MLKYIFSVVLIAAVWTAVILLELPMWIAIVATAVILVILITIVVVRVVKAKRAAADIERALQQQAAAQAANARPDMQADLGALNQEFMQAVSALKTSKLGGKKGSEALYALPWYTIIGPPGSGKSTALRNSGLRFAYLSKSGGGVQGVGGTRNCQWWMTNEAVILDTAGRYTTEESDRDEWIAFLELLKRNRPRRPINGVIVAIAMTEFIDAHAETVLGRAREIRARVDEVMAKLEMVVPVYVLFTKCDLLPGFVETFGELGNKERSQIWGFTVPVTGVRDPAGAFNEHFGELAAVLERNMVRRLTEERRTEARDKIFAFPQHFEPLKDNLAIFVGELMAASVYTESPIFRGAYFTSGTQEGSPIDRIMSGMAEAFGIQPKMNFTQPQVEAKSYFLGELFQDVVFADRNVATRTAAFQKRQALVGHSIAAGLFVVALGLAVLPVLSFQRNREFLVDTREAVTKIEDHHTERSDGGDISEPITIDRISPLLAVEREVADHEDDGVPLLMRMGMYQGAKYGDRIHQLYVKTLRQEIIRPLHKLETDEIERFAQKYGPLQDPAKPEEHEMFRDKLRAYLLLTGEYAEGEPGLNDEQKEWLAQTVTDLWNARLDKMELTGDLATMKALVTAYIDNLSKDSGLLFERDVKLVKEVRRVLNRTDRVEALLEELTTDVDARDLDLRTLTDSNVALKNDGRIVKGLYTREAFEDTIRDRLENPFDNLSGDEWVLGRTDEEAEQSKQQLVDQLKSLYFERYIKEWRGFIGAIYVVPPRDFVDAQRVFEDLTHGASPPYKRLAQYLHYHTNLPAPPAPEEAAADLLDKAGDLAKKKGGKLGKAAKAADLVKKNMPAGEGRNPLLKTREDVRIAFEGLVAFGFAPPPPAPGEGMPPPPPPAVPIDRYQEELGRVRDALRAQIDIGGDDETKTLANAVKMAKSTTDGIINESDTKGWRNTLAKWLPPPFESVWSMVGKTGGEMLQKKYCEAVYKPLKERYFDRYPFVTKGRDVNLGDFAKFFLPETGELWVYYNTALASRVPRKHGTFELSTTGAAEQNKYNPKIVKFLERADDLSRAMFPTGSDALRVEFDVWISDNPQAAVTTLEIDGKTITHRNGPGRWQRMSWPGEGDKLGAFLQTKGQMVRGGVEAQGNWGIFELMEQGTATGSSELFSVKWDLRDQEAGVVNMKFRPVEESTPFYGTVDRPVGFMEIFRNAELLGPPNVLVLGQAGCE